MEGGGDVLVRVAKEKHPQLVNKRIEYGTAGFRSKGSELDYVIFRMGLLSVLRSKHKKATIGVMITASHNPEEDNGVKLIDPLGEMLEVTWEKYATKLANVSDDKLGTTVLSLLDTTQTDGNQEAHVVFARDTRPSSISLAQALEDGITTLGGKFHNYGILTTPQLHYMVRCINSNGSYGNQTEEGYYTKLAGAFKSLFKSGASTGYYRPHLRIDGANGVGAFKMKEMLSYVGDLIQVDIFNDASSGKLNYKCGADFVKSQQKPPEGVEMVNGDRYASFDGDADRILYYYRDQDGFFRLLDGDKIATLIAAYLQDLLNQTGLQLDLGLVQTAYANGSSTDYIMNHMKTTVACAATGVKHLHHKAQEYDIGIYFEANGHGTVLFSQKAMQKINLAKDDLSLSAIQKEAVSRLICVIDLINQTVGDAISDLLLVETILASKGWGIEQWNATYTDLPYKMLKIQVKDRSVIKTTDAERRTTSPAGLQDAIDALVHKYPQGRSFVRPSGTEDVVRVYAEADTQNHADQLACQVGLQVHRLSGGVGDPQS